MNCHLHIISTGTQSLTEWLDKTIMVQRYADYIHIREPNWGEAKITKAVGLLRDSGVPQRKIIINGFPLLAEQLKVGGVHFPEMIDLQAQTLLPSLYKGSSVHGVKKAIQKEQEGADYLFFGHIFESKSKPGVSPKGLEELRKVTESVQIPVIAIGGITPYLVKECLAAGAMGVAVLSGVYETRDPVMVAKEFYYSLRGGVKHDESV